MPLGIKYKEISQRTKAVDMKTLTAILASVIKMRSCQSNDMKENYEMTLSLWKILQALNSLIVKMGERVRMKYEKMLRRKV